MVDQYAHLFFSEISTIKPDDICQKVDLCRKVVSISQKFSPNGCDLCHQVVEETVSKLKDPDTQVLLSFVIYILCRTIEKKKKGSRVLGLGSTYNYLKSLCYCKRWVINLIL